MTDDEFADLCFEFGIELDDVTSEKEIIARERGDTAATGLSEEILYKIDIPANRYDLLCLEGLVQALKVFLQKAPAPSFEIKPVNDTTPVVTVEEPVIGVRKYVVCAILRGLSFNEERYKSFIDLQTKLHANICKMRTLSSIGTHDYDTIQGPFRYTAVNKNELKFRALNQAEEHTAAELMEIYKEVKHLKPFLHILEPFENYPVIYDRNDVVLSMPPIINGDHTKITLNTKNVFIDVTGTDLTKSKIVLNTVIAAFSEYCEEQYTVEPVKVVYNEQEQIYPQFDEREILVDANYVRTIIGVDIETETMATILTKMCLKSQVVDEKTIQVKIPMTRSDILHPCDIVEDIAIAYGYNNIPRRLPMINSSAKMQPLNHFTDLLRQECALAGYTEIVTMVLLSFADNYEKMKKPIDDKAVVIANPSSIECQMPRTSLLPGLLKTLEYNQSHSPPFRIFEISDVVIKDTSHPTGAKNQRHLAALYSDQSSECEHIHGFLDLVMQKLDYEWKTDYHLELNNDDQFLQGWGVSVMFRGKRVGSMGVIHPEILENFAIPRPVVALEVNLQEIVEL